MRFSMITIPALLFTCLLSGCHPHLYTPPVQQGNIITEDMTQSLRVGMTALQVKEIMGNPILENTFHGDTLNYVYRLKPVRGDTTQKRLTITFQKGKVTHIDA